jgi:hypothetical protein
MEHKLRPYKPGEQITNPPLPPSYSNTLYKKTVHTYELRGCGDLLIWFGGPRTVVSRAPSSAVPTLSLPLSSYRDQPVSIFFPQYSVGLGKIPFH